MSSAARTSPAPNPAVDRELEMAERHRRILGEVQEVAIEVTRAYADLAIASAHSAQATLAPDAWHPELERAQAIGASRHAAEAFHRVTRALRLTMAMERAVVTGMSALEAGIVAPSAPPIFTATLLTPGADIPPLTTDSPQTRHEVRVTASEVRGGGDDLLSDPRETERLFDVERSDVFGRFKFRETVDRMCADIGVKPDWDRWEGDGRPPSGPGSESSGPEPDEIYPSVDPPSETYLRPSASRSLPPSSSPPPPSGWSVPEPAHRTASG